MRREFLKNLGIEDADTINAILNENSADIGRAKGELDTYIKKVTDLENDVKSKDGEIATLKDKAKDVDTLNDLVSQLKTEKTNLTNELNTKVSEIQKTHAIENSVRDAKAKNVKSVMALLDMDKITFENGELGGVADQLETLKKGEDTSFLFGDIQTPSGTHVNNPPNNGGGTPPTSTTFADAVAKALSK